MRTAISIRTGFVTFAAALALLLPAGGARADLLGHGPAIQLGYSPDEDAHGTAQDLALITAGWRWRWDGYDAIDDLLAKASVDISWAVEPMIGAVCGDAEAFEASVVPLVHLRPLGWEGVVPYFEAGIGIAYTSLRNYALGSRVELSDNAGVGVAFGSDLRWSIGYRFRHLSHAGIFGDTNEGLNAHFLTLSVEL
jgi:hypothetical protein